MNNYKRISNVGSNKYNPISVSNPLTYCLNDTLSQKFDHGSGPVNGFAGGQYSKNCQSFLAEYCAKNWDGYCEYASKNTNTQYPNQLQIPSPFGNGIVYGQVTQGEALIRNAAAKKYLIYMGNGKLKYEPFDPTVANSPLISTWVGKEGMSTADLVPVYSVDAKTIDQDIVMDKILEKPIIAFDILFNIYNTMKRTGSLSTLKNTKLGRFFQTNNFFRTRGGI
jgi:hypothetical protein